MKVIGNSELKSFITAFLGAYRDSEVRESNRLAISLGPTVEG